MLPWVQNWGSGLPGGVLAAAPGCSAKVLLCLQGAWAVDTDTLLLVGCSRSRVAGSPLLSSCRVVAASTERGRTLCPTQQGHALPPLVSCKEHKVLLRVSGNALCCDSGDMPVSPADPRFPLMLSSSNGCLWWHWAVGTVAAGPVLPAQGSPGCHRPMTHAEKHRSSSGMCWQLSHIPVSLRRSHQRRF